MFRSDPFFPRFTDVRVCISAAPAALDRYLAAVPAMKHKCGSHLAPVAPFSVCKRCLTFPTLFRLRPAALFEQLAQTRGSLVAIQPAVGNTEHQLLPSFAVPLR